MFGEYSGYSAGQKRQQAKPENPHKYAENGPLKGRARR